MECEDFVRIVRLTPWAHYTVYKRRKDPVISWEPKERRLKYEDEDHHLTLISGYA